MSDLDFTREEGVPIQDYFPEVENATLEWFEQNHGYGFLLGPLSLVQQPQQPQSTLDIDSVESDLRIFFRKRIDYLVFPVIQTGRSPFSFVAVGRTKNNDIVVPDVSVSKFHAFFKPGRKRQFSLQDASSKNGTFLDDKPVPAKGQAKPLPVESGSRVRFGSIAFMFLSSVDFYTFVSRLCHPAQRP